MNGFACDVAFAKVELWDAIWCIGVVPNLPTHDAATLKRVTSLLANRLLRRIQSILLTNQIKTIFYQTVGHLVLSDSQSSLVAALALRRREAEHQLMIPVIRNYYQKEALVLS